MDLYLYTLNIFIQNVFKYDNVTNLKIVQYDIHREIQIYSLMSMTMSEQYFY